MSRKGRGRKIPAPTPLALEAGTALLLATLAGALLLSCVPTPTPSVPGPPATLIPLPSPPSPMDLRIVLPELPGTLDPLTASSWAGRALQSLFLPGLWALDDRLQPQPVLAESLPTRTGGTISGDGRSLTVRLRPDLQWSDGHPLTAVDVAFTWEYAAAQGVFPYAPFVERVTAEDTQTVRVELSSPFAPWPAHLFSFVLPRHILESADAEAWRAFPSVGSGPYIPAYWEGGGLVFTANPFFWQGPPGAKRLIAYQETEARARWEAVARGEAALTVFLAPESPPVLQPPDGVRAHPSPSGYVETLFFNLDPRRGHPALQSERVRVALADVLDPEALCPALGGQAAPAWTLYSGTFWEHPGLRRSVLSPARGRRLLDESGWRDSDGDGVREWQGIPLRIRYAVSAGAAGRSAVQAQIARQWQELGVQVETVAMERPWEHPEAWDVAQWASQPPGYPDPDDPRWLCGEARPGGHNFAGCATSDWMNSSPFRPSRWTPKTGGALFEIQALAHEQRWWVPLCRWEERLADSGGTDGPPPLARGTLLEPGKPC